MKIYRTKDLNSIFPQAWLPGTARKFWDLVRLDKIPEATNSYVAWDKNQVVGFYRYRILPSGKIKALGTWVALSHRRKGLATKFWKKLLKEEKPEVVEVTTTNPKAQKFIIKFQQANPNVRFIHKSFVVAPKRWHRVNVLVDNEGKVVVKRRP